jgi:hypothetical protein
LLGREWPDFVNFFIFILVHILVSVTKVWVKWLFWSIELAKMAHPFWLVCAAARYSATGAAAYPLACVASMLRA